MSLMTIQRLFGWDQVGFFLLPSFLPSFFSFFLIVAWLMMIELLETHMRKVSPSRVEELVKIFIRATELECSFWDMGLAHQA